MSVIHPSRRAMLAALGAAFATTAAAAPLTSAPPPRRPGARAAPRAEGAVAPAGPEGAELAARAGLQGSVGFCVIDVASGAILDGFAAERPFAPASVAKIPTALFALEIMGPQRRFATRVLADGTIDGGRLKGALALAGGGDPELDSAELAALARDAAGALRGVEGGFVVDAGHAIAQIDGTQDPEASYNPAVAALNLNYNRVRLAWARKGGRLDARMEAHAERWTAPVASVALDVAPDDCGCPTFAHSDGAAAELWRVRGAAMRGDGSVWLPVRAPARYAAEVFRIAAAEAGLPLPAGAPGVARGAEIARRESRPLIEMVRDMLRWSTNLTAEAIGQAAAGPAAAGDLAASAAVMSRWAAARAGFPSDAEFMLANHSGLSPAAGTSPRRMAQLVAAAGRGDDALLPDLLTEREIDDAAGKGPAGVTVRAKTGTLDFARGLAGYLETGSGRKMAFAIFANDLDRRVDGRSRQTARAWRNRATTLERALLRNWAARFA